jgi:SAM-dependent methyltransferase
MFLRNNAGLAADLINPDPADLAATRRLIEACELTGRVQLHAQTIEDADLPSRAYELMTCVSVLEHIPRPRAAIEAIWRALGPGGALIVSVPCAREGFDEYPDFNEYGLLSSDSDGWVFGQRSYDNQALERELFAVFGSPTRMEVFGERKVGSFVAARAARMAGTHDVAREPYAVATNYRRFASVDELPGIGVAAMEFRREALDV